MMGTPEAVDQPPLEDQKRLALKRGNKGGNTPIQKKKKKKKKNKKKKKINKKKKKIKKDKKFKI